MNQFEEDDFIVASPSISGASSNSVKTKLIADNAQVSVEKPKDDKNTDNNKDKGDIINKEGRVRLINMI